MKKLSVLIVDDEVPVRKWFAMTFKSLRDVAVDLVGIASNGEEALQIFREKKPDVVFTDIKMPRMDGMALLRAIKQESPGTEIVMVSSYDEFVYAKEALSLDAFEYILKTEVNARVLSDILLRIDHERKERENRRSLISQRFKQEVFLNRLLDDSQPPVRCNESVLIQNGIFIKESAMFAVAFKINSFDSSDMEDKLRLPGVENVVFYSYQKGVVVALANADCIHQAAYQNKVMYQFADMISRHFMSTVGLSAIYNNYSSIPDMIQKSVLTLDMSFYKTRGCRVYNAWEITDYKDMRQQLHDYEEEINAELSRKDFVRVSDSVKRLLDFIKEKAPVDVKAIKQLLFQTIVRIYVAGYKNRMELPERISTIHQEIEVCRSFSSLAECVQNAAKDIVAERSEKIPNCSPYVSKAIKYVEKNYAHLESVSDVADHVGLNPDYFCHLFKNDTGMTFSNYLNNVKINEAIRLLNNTQMKTSEIAEQVGYSNQSYFSKLFKKKVNMTPHDFRMRSHEFNDDFMGDK